MSTTWIPRIGDILVSQGVLTAEQVEVILDHQGQTGEPFGEVAEALFAVTPRQIEAAWVEQYLASGTRVDLDRQPTDPAVRDNLSVRQAWQMQLLPLRREDGMLVVATSSQRLARSVKFLWRVLKEPVYVVVAEAEQLHRHLEQVYPSPLAQVQRRG